MLFACSEIYLPSGVRSGTLLDEKIFFLNAVKASLGLNFNSDNVFPLSISLRSSEPVNLYILISDG